MKRRVFLSGGTAAITATLTGCGGGGSAADDIAQGADDVSFAAARAKKKPTRGAPAPTPAPTPAPAPAPAPAEAQPPVPVGAKTFDTDFNDPTSPLMQWEGGPFVPYATYYGGEMQPEGEAGYRWWGDALSAWTSPLYTPAPFNPFSIANGVLTMTVRAAAPDYPNSPKPYLAGSLETTKGAWWLDAQTRAAHPGFEQKYGYFECRCKIPRQQGLWPAFWLNGSASATGRGELDIFEVVSTSGLIHQTGHDFWGTHTFDSSAIAVDFDHSADFHTYGLHWTPTEIVWYIDGKVTKRASAAMVAKYRDICGPMFITVGMGIGNVGSWSGAPDSTTVLPAYFAIDYVRAYALA